MPVFDNMNYSYSEGVAVGIVDYYERTLLENAKPEMIHGRDAQKRSLPEGNGKHVQFRRMIPYAAVTEPLKEGVTPAGQEIRQTAMTAMVKPYGRHVEITDELDLYHLDNLHRETAKLLSDQATLSLDTIARDALHSGMNVQFAGGKANRAALTADDKLTPAEIKKAVRTLKRNNCKPFADGYYHAIVHPDTIYDLTASDEWIDVAKYQDKSKIEKYELGTMYKVKFFESTNAKVYEEKPYLYGTTATLTIVSSEEATRTAVISEAITSDDARALTGLMVQVTGDGASTLMCVERVDYANKKITFRWMPEGGVSGSIKPEGTAAGVNVFGTLIYGADAFGSIDLGGNGKNVQVIIKPVGSSGAADPINQRGTIAWKVKGFTTVILQDSYLVRIEHGATA